jgi:hypothetical protein
VPYRIPPLAHNRKGGEEGENYSHFHYSELNETKYIDRSTNFFSRDKRPMKSCISHDVTPLPLWKNVTDNSLHENIGSLD